MFDEVEWSREQLLTGDSEESKDERVKAIKALIRDHNRQAKVLNAFIRLANKLPNF